MNINQSIKFIHNHRTNKSMRRTIQILALGLLLGTTGAALSAPPHTGLQGHTFSIWPGFWHFIEPGVAIGVGSIQLPWSASFTVVSAHNGREITRVTSDAAGFYSVSLPPGKYVLVPEPILLNAFIGCTASATPFEVEVKAREFKFLNVFYTAHPCIISANAE
jgi:hypothetical protein